MTKHLNIELMREMALTKSYKEIAKRFKCSEYKIVTDCIKHNIPKIDKRLNDPVLITWDHLQ